MLLRILCVHIETSSLWAEFVNKNRCINVSLVSEEDKSILFWNFDNSHNSFLWPEYFIDFLCERWIPCQAVTRLWQGCDTAVTRRWHLSCVYITAQRLQYKRCVHLWNNFPCIITLTPYTGLNGQNVLRITPAFSILIWKIIFFKIQKKLNWSNNDEYFYFYLIIFLPISQYYRPLGWFYLFVIWLKIQIYLSRVTK